MIRSFFKGSRYRNFNSRRVERLLLRNDCREVTVPLYFFDIKDGHRLVDPRGRNLKNDAEAIAKAKVMAIGVSLDKPEVNPARSIVVIDDDGREIFRQPVYPPPAAAC